MRPRGRNSKFPLDSGVCSGHILLSMATALLALLFLAKPAARARPAVDQARFSAVVSAGTALRLALSARDLTTSKFQELSRAVKTELEHVWGKTSSLAERRLVGKYIDAEDFAERFLTELSPADRPDAPRFAGKLEAIRRDLAEAEAIYSGGPLPQEVEEKAPARREASNDSGLLARAGRVFILQDAERLGGCKEVGKIDVTAPEGGGVVVIQGQRVGYRTATELVRLKTVEAGGNAFLSGGLEMVNNDIKYRGTAYLCPQR
jgi:hypothetical protein